MERRPYRVVLRFERSTLIQSYHDTSDEAYSAGEQRAGFDKWYVEYYTAAGWARVRQCPTRAANGA